MKRKKFPTLLSMLIILIALPGNSCTQQTEGLEEITQKGVAPTIDQIIIAVEPTELSFIPTHSPTPREAKLADGFNKCHVASFISIIDDDALWRFIGINKPVYENSKWILNNGKIETVIGKSKTVGGITTFTVDNTKILVTEGTILQLYFYIENTSEATQQPPQYILLYSPTSNEFVENTSIMTPPYNFIKVFKDSPPKIPSYQGDYCINQIEYFNAESNLESLMCVITQHPNRDEYGWGINENGDTICPKIEKTEK